MKTLLNESLAPYTSLRVGGPAEKLLLPESYGDILAALTSNEHVTVLGYGCNILVSDAGIPGTTVMWRGGEIVFEDTVVIADAGVWWDVVVKASVEKNLWGLELMSEIPSSVGGAVFGNIAAYGQQVSDTLLWVDIFNKKTKAVTRHGKQDFAFAYRQSSLQDEPEKVILRVAFQLSYTPLHTLRYDSALTVAKELGLDTQKLADCRAAIVETRKRAGSIYHPDDATPERTAGSFFKNPLVSEEQAVFLAEHDETGKTLSRIKNQSQVHGGDSHRASAAHVMLASGFTRGETWGNVQLHPSHVLKVSTLPGATADELYAVVKNIVKTVHDKTGITLEPEVRFIGF